MNAPIRMRNYGRVLQDLIAYAVSLPEGEQRQALATTIAQTMASRNLLWNSDQETSPDRVLRDMETLSEGRLVLPLEQFEAMGIRPTNVNPGMSNKMKKRNNRRR